MFIPVVLLAAQLGPVTDVRRTFAAGEKTAVLMAPPETVCGAGSGQTFWTADGSSLVVKRISGDYNSADLAAIALHTPAERALQERQRQEIVTWDLKTRKPHSVFSLPLESGSIDRLDPIPGSDRVVFEVFEVKRDANGNIVGQSGTTYLLATGSGTVFRISQVADLNEIYEHVGVSMRRPLASIMRTNVQQNTASVRYFGPDGRLGPSIPVPKKTHPGFDAGGYPGFVIYDPPVEHKPRTFHFKRIDPMTGQEIGTAVYDPSQAVPEPKKSELSVVSVDSVSNMEKAKAPAVFLRVEGGKQEESGIVTTDGGQAILSPKSDAVAYQSQGSTIVRLLAAVPRDAYDAALLAEQRREVVSRAKQLGLALLMYAGDMDDTMPGQDVNLRSKLEPYTKNDSLFEGFNYTFEGGALTSVEKPAETTVGYVSGPGGRAVIFVDGHVKWIPDNS